MEHGLSLLKLFLFVSTSLEEWGLRMTHVLQGIDAIIDALRGI